MEAKMPFIRKWMIPDSGRKVGHQLPIWWIYDEGQGWKCKGRIHFKVPPSNLHWSQKKCPVPLVFNKTKIFRSPVYLFQFKGTVSYQTQATNILDWKKRDTSMILPNIKRIIIQPTVKSSYQCKSCKYTNRERGRWEGHTVRWQHTIELHLSACCKNRRVRPPSSPDQCWNKLKNNKKRKTPVKDVK